MAETPWSTEARMRYWLKLPAVDWRAVTAEGRARQTLVETGLGSSFRMAEADRSAESVVGAQGEFAFADYFGLPRPRFQTHRAGDDGYEFETPWGPLDVKAAKSKPWFLPVRESSIQKARAAMYGLIWTPLGADFTYFVGWCRFAVAAEQARLPNCYEPTNPRPRRLVPGRIVRVTALEDPQTLAALLACAPEARRA